MFLNRGMNTENVVHLHNERLQEIFKQMMKLETIILSEVTQSQKNTHGMYTLISGY